MEQTNNNGEVEFAIVRDHVITNVIVVHPDTPGHEELLATLRSQNDWVGNVRDLPHDSDKHQHPWLHWTREAEGQPFHNPELTEFPLYGPDHG